ncbi:MAG TPA: shikimate kinase [Candidatus Onthovicinus excrementipullorum]|nr:shikimate kinase [Candidatus Onthovicinus excrementipullorum]
MEIQDNVLKEYLKNVYFITGTACSGKTTVSRALAAKHGFAVYDADQAFDRHRELSNRKDQPAMNKNFKDADVFFFRPYKEYADWLEQNAREQLAFILMDLIGLSQSRVVICDLHLTPDEAEWITEPDRVVFLLRNPENIIEDYCNRPDHSDFNQFINSASDPVRAKNNCNQTLAYVNRERYENVKKSRYFWLERDQNSTVERTVLLVEKYFGFDSSRGRGYGSLGNP